MKFLITIRESRFRFLLFICIISVSCDKKDEDPIMDWESHRPFNAEYTISNLSFNNNFSKTVKEINEVGLFEVSGLAESQLNNDALWAHNDSGNGNILYLLEKNTGKIKVQYRLKGIPNIDWEDIEVGPGPVPGVHYIYLGDIGDNLGIRESATIFRFQEPVFEESHEGKFIELDLEIEKLNFIYPEGARDAESLLIDHNTLDLYIVTKRDFPARLYAFPFPQDPNNTTSLVLAGSFPLFAPVGGNVHPNGEQILIKNYDKVFYWSHDINEPLWKTLSNVPELASYDPVEPQGEAICFDTAGGYYTLGEKVGEADVILYKYNRRD